MRATSTCTGGIGTGRAARLECSPYSGQNRSNECPDTVSLFADITFLSPCSDFLSTYIPFLSSYRLSSFADTLSQSSYIVSQSPYTAFARPDRPSQVADTAFSSTDTVSRFTDIAFPSSDTLSPCRRPARLPDALPHGFPTVSFSALPSSPESKGATAPPLSGPPASSPPQLRLGKGKLTCEPHATIPIRPANQCRALSTFPYSSPSQVCCPERERCHYSHSPHDR